MIFSMDRKYLKFSSHNAKGSKNNATKNKKNLQNKKRMN